MSDDGTPTLPQARLAAKLAALGFEPTHAPVRPDASETLRVAADLHRVSVSTGSMRTRVSVTAVADSPDQAHEAIGRAMDEMRRVVSLLNRHDGGSALSVLNDKGGMDRPPPELTTVLRGAGRMHALTRGGFDATVKPLVDLLKRDPGAMEHGPDLGAALDLVDMGALRVSDHRVDLEREGMGLTLDGIAKGYIVDRMAAMLHQGGLGNWIIEAGGDIRASGENERGRPWRIGVRDPEGGNAYPDVTEIGQGAVATSGGYESFYDEAQTAHHIVDSATGRSPSRTRSATVTAPTAAMADALATAALVLPAYRALSVVTALPDCSCMLLDADGRRYATATWHSASTLH